MLYVLPRSAFQKQTHSPGCRVAAEDGPQLGVLLGDHFD